MSERRDTMARTLIDKRKAKDEAEAKADAAKRAYKQVEQEFWADMAEEGMTTFTSDLGPGYGKVQFQKRQTVRGIILDKDKAAESLREEGLDDGLLGAPEIRKAALNEHVRDLVAAGQPLPEGIDFSDTKYVSISRK